MGRGVKVVLVIAASAGLAWVGHGAAKTNAPVRSAALPFPDRLTVADVRQVMGWSGVKFVPRGSKPRANGDLNFVNQTGDVVLTVRFRDAATYRKTKAAKEIYFTDVKGLADDAFQGPAQAPHFLLFALKDKQSALLSTYVSQDATATNGPVLYLTPQQLQQLAATLLPRL
jgi:hypothetical protein